MNRIKHFGTLFLLLLLVALPLGCQDDDDDDDASNPAQAGDDDDSTDDVDDDDDDDDATGPESVQIESVHAPTQYEVVVEFAQDLGSFGNDVSYYSISDTKSMIAIKSATYDPSSLTATISTGKQKLGIEYTLSFSAGEVSDQGAFLSADTAMFWAHDFSDGDEYQVSAKREGIGEKCVIYIQESWSVPDVNETIDTFDLETYPTLTHLFTTAPDMDDNDRIVILGLDGGDFYGGYFSSIHTLEDEDTMNWWGMHSNEMEIIFINVQYESLSPTRIIPHEFQHLLYNGYHGLNAEYWNYHNEGLAECAVHVMSGPLNSSISFYQNDSDEMYANGMSLVNWQYANFNSYVLGYMFWAYLASRADGEATFVDIFNLEDGNPQRVDGLIKTLLGQNESFASVQQAQYIANWLQTDSGIYNYGDMFSFDPQTAPTVNADVTSLDLEPFGAAIFMLDEAQVTYPGTQGANVAYAAIDSAGSVDLTEPFDVGVGGVLVVHNQSQEAVDFLAEYSGPDIAALKAKTSAVPITWQKIPPRWLCPPPVTPNRQDLIDAWRDAALIRIADGFTVKGNK